MRGRAKPASRPKRGHAPGPLCAEPPARHGVAARYQKPYLDLFGRKGCRGLLRSRGHHAPALRAPFPLRARRARGGGPAAGAAARLACTSLNSR
jgi:hypothetical protein